MSLDRLIRLAKKTGDRLIIHDPHGTDIVLMDVDSYEALVDTQIQSFNKLLDEHMPMPMDEELDLYSEAEPINPFAEAPDQLEEIDNTLPVEEDQGSVPADLGVDLTPEPTAKLPDEWATPAAVLKDRFEPPTPPIVIEDLPQEVPFKPQNIGELDEKALDDNPVFLEEPI